MEMSEFARFESRIIEGLLYEYHGAHSIQVGK